MVLGQLRVAVIGAQTLSDGANKPYTVFRTAVNFRGQCYQRLIRYRQFSWFHKRLHLRDASSPEAKAIVFPGRVWTRSASLQEDVVEARQVLLNEYMDKVTSVELTPGCYDRLLRLLKVGDYDVDPPQGHPAPQKPPMRKDGHRNVDFHKDLKTHEDAVATAIEQQQRRNRASGKSSRSANGATDQIGGGSATIVTPSVVYRSVMSTAETVPTDEERPVSTDGESSDDHALTDDDEQDSLRSRQSLASASYAQQIIADRPKLRASMSTPVRRVKKVKFDVRIETKTPHPSPADAGALRHTVVGDSPPESKLRGKVENHLSRIQGVLSWDSSHDADQPHVPLELLMSSQPAVLARNRAETL